MPEAARSTHATSAHRPRQRAIAASAWRPATAAPALRRTPGRLLATASVLAGSMLLAVAVGACGGGGGGTSDLPPVVQQQSLSLLPAAAGSTTDLGPHDVLVLRFSHALDAATVAGSLIVTSSVTGVLPGAIQHPAPDTLYFVPSAPFRLGESLLATVQHTLTGNNGERLATGTHSRQFTVTSFRTSLQDPALLRSSAPAVVLHDGRILIAGGAGSERSTVIFDPVTRSFTTSGDLNEGRLSHIAAVLDDGRVAVIGGQSSVDGIVRDSVELWNPANGQWQLAPVGVTARSEDHAAFRLVTSTGASRWVVLGGYHNSLVPGENVQGVIDVFNADFSSVTQSAHTVTLGGKSALSDDGQYIVLAGTAGQFANSRDAEVLRLDPDASDPVVGVTFFDDALTTPAQSIGVAAIDDRRFLLAAGNTLEVLTLGLDANDDPDALVSTPGPAYTAGNERRFVQLARLPGGGVFVSPGRNATTTGSIGQASVYRPAAGSGAGTLAVNDVVSPRRVHSTVVAANGEVLCFSGRFQLTSQTLDLMDIISREGLMADRLQAASAAACIGFTPRDATRLLEAGSGREVRLHFSGALDYATVTPSTLRLRVNGLGLPYTPAQGVTAREVVVPLPPLAAGDLVEVTLLAGIKDLADRDVNPSAGLTGASWRVR